MRRSDILSGLQAARQQNSFGVVAGVQSVSVTFCSPDSDRHRSIVIAFEVCVVEVDGVVAVLEGLEPVVVQHHSEVGAVRESECNIHGSSVFQ